MSRERGGWPKRPNGPESSASCFFSTASVYESFEGEWADEDSPVAPHSPYSKSKLDAERVLLDLTDSRFKPVILRLPTLFGDSESLRLDVIVNKLVLRLLNGLPLEIHGEGRQFRPFAHVADVARMAVKALEFSLENRENLIVNTCLEKLNFSVREVVEAVANPFPKAVVTQGTHLDLSKITYRVRSNVLGEWFGEEDFAGDLKPAILQLYEHYRKEPLKPYERIMAVRCEWLDRLVSEGRLDRDMRSAEPLSSGQLGCR